MTVKALYPNLRPSLLLDFANTKDLDPRITFTRTTTARYYDGKTTAKAEENLFLRSQEFDNDAWQKVNTTATANTEVAPDGTTTAETIADTVDTNSHRITQNPVLSASTRYVYSVFVKNINRRYVTLTVSGAQSNYFGATYDLVGETVTATRQSGSGFAHISSSITAVGNGWYRVVLIGDTGTTVSFPASPISLSTSGTPSVDSRGNEVYLGDGSSIYIWGAQLEQRSSVTAYTPTTDQPITNYIPVLQTAAAGVARFDHNPVTGESLGLLIEEQRSNLLTYSDDFADASWVKTATTNRSFVSSNVLIGPDGLLSADKLYESELNVDHWLRKAFNFSASTNYTFSIYAKAAERTIFRLTAAGADQGAYFNLSDGTIGTVQSGVTAAITSVGNGWYRCSISWTQASGLNDYVYIRFALVNNGSGSYTGDGYSGIYIWGAQLEAGAFPTSYIPTVASSVTRNADAASMTGANFSSWFNPEEGTIYYDGAAVTSGPQTGLLSLRNSSDNNRLQLFYLNGSYFFRVRTNGADEAQISRTPGDKLSGAYKVNDVRYVTSSQNIIASDTSCVMPVGISQLDIGVSSRPIKKIAYYTKAITSAEMQALTTN
jgi:hypothetical protein